jgi:mannose-6-phosphate isomerase-like protein (cupin superfamily)
MTINLKQNWSEKSTSAISEETIRAVNTPAENFKFYANAYELGQQFAVKAGHDFTLYIISGACKTSIDGKELRLSSAEFATMAAGSYAFEAIGTEDLQLLKVFSRV